MTPGRVVDGNFADTPPPTVGQRQEPPPLARSLSLVDRPEQPTMDSIEHLATRNASEALSIALAQADPSVRQAFLLAVIRGWAKSNIDAAERWVLGQTYMGREEALDAFFNGAVTHREAAIRFAHQISRERPAQAEAFGQALISSLGQAGDYERAAQFAAEEETSDFAIKFLTSAYRQWSEQAPEAATLSALALRTPEARSFALQSTVPVWARVDPAALAEKARDFPAGPEKTLALTVALRAWFEKDLDATYAWVARWEPTGALSSVDLKFVLED